MNPRVELVVKLAKAYSGRSVDGNVLEPERRIFSGNVEGLQMTASSRVLSRTDLNEVDETRGNVNVEEGDLVVNEKNSDRQLQTHHMVTGENGPKELPKFCFGLVTNYR